MVEVGRDVQRSSAPTSLLRQGHLDQVAQDCVHTVAEYLQGWRLHNLSGPSVLNPTVKKIFLIFRWNLLSFSLCPRLWQIV